MGYTKPKYSVTKEGHTQRIEVIGKRPLQKHIDKQYNKDKWIRVDSLTGKSKSEKPLGKKRKVIEKSVKMKKKRKLIKGKDKMKNTSDPISSMDSKKERRKKGFDAWVARVAARDNWSKSDLEKYKSIPEMGHVSFTDIQKTGDPVNILKARKKQK